MESANGSSQNSFVKLLRSFSTTRRPSTASSDRELARSNSFQTSLSSNKSLSFQTSVASNKSLSFQTSLDSRSLVLERSVESSGASKGIESSDFNEEWAVFDIVDADEHGDTDRSHFDSAVNDTDDYLSDDAFLEHNGEKMDPLRVSQLGDVEGHGAVKPPSEEDKIDRLVQQRSIDEALFISDHVSKSLQKERQLLQAKTFASWLNCRLEHAPGSPQIVDLFEDLRDGKYLLALLEQLTGQVLKPVKGNMKVHHLSNLAKVFEVLEELGIKLVGIHNENICDGNVIFTLGLCWRLIYYFQVLHSVDTTVDSKGGTAEKALLEWCFEIAKSYAVTDVKSFEPNRWKAGGMLQAIVHSYNPKLFDYEKLSQLKDTEKVQHALDTAYTHYGVPKLFSHSDFENNLIDSNTLILYVSMLKQQMDIFRKNQENEAMDVLERLQIQLDSIRKSLEEKEGAELLNPRGDLSFHDSKTFSGQYEVLLKELDSMVSELGKVEEAIKTVDGISEESLATFNTDLRNVEDRVKTMMEKCGAYFEDSKQNRIDIVQGKLDKVNNDILHIKMEKEKAMEGLKKDASKEELKECDRSIKDLLQNLAQTKTEFKATCSLVDEAYADKMLPKDARQKLKSETIKVLEEYANLKDLLEKDQKKLKTVVDKMKNIEEKFNCWRGEVKDLEEWLDERINKYEDMEFKYDDVAKMKNVLAEVQDLLAEMKNGCWKRFQDIASKWNGELCDEINDDKYADTLSDVQAKFNKLHGVVMGVHTRTNDMLNQKNGEDDLLSKLLGWNLYVDSKETQLHEIDLDAEDVDKFQEQVESILKDMTEKENDVKSFLSSSFHLLQANRYDDSAVSEMEGNLEAFRNNWDKLREAYEEKKAKMDHIVQLRIVQRESERNLAERLLEWKKTLNVYTLRLHGINLKEYSTIEKITLAIKEIEVLMAEINGHDDALQEYDREASTLIDNMEKKNALVLNEDFQQFLKDWDELKVGSVDSLSRLNASMEMSIASDDASMKAWEVKAMVTEELLEACEEVAVYSSNPDLDDFEDYLKKLDDLEVKVTNHGDTIDSNIEESKTLLDQLKVQENKEKVKSSVDTFTLKKTKLLEEMVAAKRMSIQLKEKQRMRKENEDSITMQLCQWQKHLDDNNVILNNCDINSMFNVSETLINEAVHTLETLIERINSIEDQLNDFDTNSKELLNTLQSAKAAQLKGELRLFFTNWDLCQGKATERLSGLKNQLARRKKSENSLMAEWTSNALKNITWLEQTIEDTKLYLSLPEEPFDVQVRLSEFKEIQNKVNCKMEHINEQKDYGHKLIEDGKVQEEENKGEVLKNIAVIIEKESVIEENLSNSQSIIEEQIRAIVLKKVHAFWDWLPTVQKRLEEGDEIGPDFEAVAKQIQEMKDIEEQATQISFSGLLDQYKSNNILDFLTEEDKENLKSSKDEWNKIKILINERLVTLKNSGDIWADFKARKIELLEYLRDIENDLKSSTALDLKDTVKVEETTDELKTVTSGMEARKNQVSMLTETADKLISLLSGHSKTDSEQTLPNSVISQVADVLHSWNSMVKRSIELKTKLQASRKKFELLEKAFCEVRDWIDDCNSLLIQFTDDVSGVYIDQLRVSIEMKQREEEDMKDKLREVNERNEELSIDLEVIPHYTLSGTITDLNEDFASTCEQLEKLRKFPGKVRILSRRVRGSARKLTSNRSTRKNLTPS